MKLLHRQCPVCQNKYGTVIENIKMVLPKDVRLPNAYDVVCCDACGFTFADADASQDVYNTYYKTCNDYSQSAALKSETTDSMNQIRFELLRKYVPKNANILDIGCGSGRLLKQLKDNGYEHLYGIDPSKDSIQKLKELGMRGGVKNIFDAVAKEHKNKFDVVMSTAVIEHIYDLNTFILQLLSYLVTENGMLFIDAPAVEGFEKYDMPRANYFNQEHINYFSLVSMDNLFSKYGCIRKSNEDESFAVVGEKQPEMAITAIYERSSQKRERIKDEIACRSVRNYFAQDKEKEEAVYDKIQKFLQQYGTPVMIWGTGAYTMQLLQKMPELQSQIGCFIDNNRMKTGRQILGKEVFTADMLVQKKLRYPILICSMLNADDIEAQIKQMGIPNPYLAV